MSDESARLGNFHMAMNEAAGIPDPPRKGKRSKAYQEMVAKLGIEQIVIERREVIDTLTLTSDGTGMPDLTEAEYGTPLIAAFVLVGNWLEDYLRDNVGGTDSDPHTPKLEFKYQAHTFRISAEFTG